MPISFINVFSRPIGNCSLELKTQCMSLVDSDFLVAMMREDTFWSKVFYDQKYAVAFMKRIRGDAELVKAASESMNRKIYKKWRKEDARNVWHNLNKDNFKTMEFLSVIGVTLTETEIIDNMIYVKNTAGLEFLLEKGLIEFSQNHLKQILNMRISKKFQMRVKMATI